MRRTKIVCTLGPAVDDVKMLSRVCMAGMDVARFNFSHGDYADQQKRIDLFKSVREELNLQIPMMLDTKGPEIRIGTFKDSEVFLNDGDSFILAHDNCEGTSEKVYVNYESLYSEIKPGTTILVNDGLIELEVAEIINKDIKCNVIHGGKLTNRKSVNVPGLSLNFPLLTDKDKSDIIWGAEQGFDMIAASFVRKPEDIIAIKDLLKEHNASHIAIIAKIENQEGVDNFDEILKVADGIMVARGDLGVEVPMQKVPSIQKQFISKCNEKGKVVIVATQMLESMTNSPRPTRAEVNDVANAVYDGTTAVMLSGEVAAGKYPVECVKTMAQIATTVEDEINYWEEFSKRDYSGLVHNKQNLIVGHVLCELAMQSSAKAIFSLSSGGHTPRAIASFKPDCPIYAITTKESTARLLKSVWGVTPILVQEADTEEEMIKSALQISLENEYIATGDTVVIGESDTYASPGLLGVTSTKKVGGIYVV
mgnify:CR=1 FL=1